MTRSSLLALGCVALVGIAWLGVAERDTRAQDAPIESPPAAMPIEQEAAAQTERIAELEKTLTHAVLVGHYTASDRGDEPREERYELGVVKHIGGDAWMISARIKYGEHDVTVPLTLPIRWAGDTPVITVDDMAFPGMGSYTARVMIYRDHYAGFWTGKDHGGHLYGRLEHREAPAETTLPAAEPAATPN